MPQQSSESEPQPSTFTAGVVEPNPSGSHCFVANSQVIPNPHRKSEIILQDYHDAEGKCSSHSSAA